MTSCRYDQKPPLTFSFVTYRFLSTQRAHKLLQSFCLNNPHNQRVLFSYLDFFLEDMNRYLSPPRILLRF